MIVDGSKFYLFIANRFFSDGVKIAIERVLLKKTDI